MMLWLIASPCYSVVGFIANMISLPVILSDWRVNYINAEISNEYNKVKEIVQLNMNTEIRFLHRKFCICQETNLCKIHLLLFY